MITIIDYKMGNIGSIQNMIKRIGENSIITSFPEEINKAEKLILPGVGSFDEGVMNLEKLDLLTVIKNKVLNDKVPILGICLGMQLLTEKSEEGKLPGLGLIKGETIKFKLNNGFKIPHMGWNTVRKIKNSKLLKEMQENSRYYFVHSYHVVCKERQDILLETNYGYDFTSAIQIDNIIGTQFHPEKSHKFGMKILENFVNLN